MRVLIFIFLVTSCLIYRGNATENKNQIPFVNNPIHGGEQEQDPSDPKYQEMAEASFKYYMETHNFTIVDTPLEYNIKKATTQIVTGDITRLTFDVILPHGGISRCRSKIWTQMYDMKTYDVDCNVLTNDNARLTRRRSHNRHDLVTEAVRKYLQHENGVDIQFAGIDIRNVRVVRKKITYYKVDAFIHNSDGDHSIYNCSVVTASWFGSLPFATKCIKRTFLMGRSEWVDPTNRKYLSFAEKALKLYLKNNHKLPHDYKKYDVIVTFVSEGLAAGDVDDIDFVARWNHIVDLEPILLKCKANIWQKLDGKNEIEKVHCREVPWNNPRDHIN